MASRLRTVLAQLSGQGLPFSGPCRQRCKCRCRNASAQLTWSRSAGLSSWPGQMMVVSRGAFSLPEQGTCIHASHPLSGRRRQADTAFRWRLGGTRRSARESCKIYILKNLSRVTLWKQSRIDIFQTIFTLLENRYPRRTELMPARLLLHISIERVSSIV